MYSRREACAVIYSRAISEICFFLCNVFIITYSLVLTINLHSRMMSFWLSRDCDVIFLLLVGLACYMGKGQYRNSSKDFA